MTRLATISIACALLGSTATAQTPVADLAKPPADATHYTILSNAGRHGETTVWRTPDGMHWSRDSLNLRGQIFELDQAAKLAPDGSFISLVSRGFTPSGDAAETFTVDNGRASWRSQIDAGAAPYAKGALYVPFGGANDATMLLLDALLARPDHRAALLPSGEARLEPLTTAVVGAGPTRKTVTAWQILGLNFSPIPIWSDDKGQFFGQVDSGLSILPAGYEGDLVSLQSAQTAAMAKRAPMILKAVMQPVAGPVAFTHVEMFDSQAEVFRHDMDVVVNGETIASVSPAGAPIPTGARIIDGHGMTLLPGLWDMHQHYANDDAGPLLLSMGVTSARDPGNNNAATLDRRARRAAGQLLSPNVYPSSLIDGHSPYTAQVGTAVGSLDEALAVVRKAKADGFSAIKIYGSFNPAWVAPTAAEAHRLGLHVHGHVPAGMRPLDAVNDGYDEITHINFVMMQAMPQAVVDKSNTIARMEGMGRYAGDVDLGAEPMASLVNTLAERHIAVDPTLSVFEGELVPEPGDLSPAYAPFIGTLPPAVERSFRAGGLAVPKDSSRAQFRKGFAKLEALVADLRAHHVRIVAGTDGSGLELIRELELYVDAGLTPAEAIEAATLDGARVVGADKTTGSIEPGKTADLVLVEGDPSAHIGDLRHTRLVMLAGHLMDADALRTAAGFSGRPK